MASTKLFLCVVFCFIFLAEVVTSSDVISLEALQANNVSYDGLHSRSMIQVYAGAQIYRTKKRCKVNFDNENYKPLRRRCMPPYPVNRCCHGLKKIACNHVDEINDIKTKCAEDMFRNIQKWYPIGWFFSHCKEGPHGLTCPRRRQKHIH